MFSVDEKGIRRTATEAQRARRAYELEEAQSREMSAEDLRRALIAAQIGFRRGGTQTPASPPSLLGEGGRGMRRLPEMIDRAVEGPADLVAAVPRIERRPGAERLHPTSLRASGMSYGIRDIKDLIQADSDVGIEPAENPFMMSLWSHVARENEKHKDCKCSVVGNLAPRRGLARKIKYMSLNPSIYGNKYSVLGTS